MLCIIENNNYNEEESDSQRERGGERNSGKGLGRRIASCISQPSISYLNASTLSLSIFCVSLIQCAYSCLWRRNSEKRTDSVYCVCEEEAAAMAELSGDSVCLDVETIYLGGKVVSYLSFRLLFQLLICCFQFPASFCYCIFLVTRERERRRVFWPELELLVCFYYFQICFCFCV